ncbi:hypothetical protein [Streptomyces dubilierae]|uniref:Uncharacterized protein n=1 Tax=Streptomyces dubilierae TaxID=3075533 RepID=A0ABU2PCA6_9ACTN|nr:hypothetical protein [Streptomyces sp. DSM 41921]MDT0389403.1 hypothetical protein [Streptomyces sp. DSM 41921]
MDRRRRAGAPPRAKTAAETGGGLRPPAPASGHRLRIVAALLLRQVRDVVLEEPRSERDRRPSSA